MARDSDNDHDNEKTEETDPNRDRISESVKRVYDEVASEPLPDKLIDLLNSLKKSGDPA